MCDKFILFFVLLGKKNALPLNIVPSGVVAYSCHDYLKTTVNAIVNIAAVILALIYSNGEFIPPYHLPSLRQAF